MANYTQQCRSCHRSIEGTGEDICYTCLQVDRDQWKRTAEQLRQESEALTADNEALRLDNAALLRIKATSNALEAQLEAERDLARQQQKNATYSERDKLVAALSKLFQSHLSRHPDSDTSWDNDWRWIVCIHAPVGQMTWHIHDSELEWFAHLDRYDAGDWDGHATEEKYERLAAIQNPNKNLTAALKVAEDALGRMANASYTEFREWLEPRGWTLVDNGWQLVAETAKWFQQNAEAAIQTLRQGKSVPDTPPSKRIP